MNSKNTKLVLIKIFAITIFFITILTNIVSYRTIKAYAMSNDMQACYDALKLSAAENNLQNKEDFELPSKAGNADIVKWSITNGSSEYITIEGNTAKVTRPYAGKGNQTVNLTATLNLNGETAEKTFDVIIREGLSDDSLAGYVYVCFADLYLTEGVTSNETDIQQTHFFLSENGLNWTALNGCNPAFLAGSDFSVGTEVTNDIIIESKTTVRASDESKGYQQRNIDYSVGSHVNIEDTVTGDASVLFPFEGEDNGIRDPYMLRGARNDDSDKIYLLATDLNTHQYKYGSNLAAGTLGSNAWNVICNLSSTRMFVWETDDNMKTWTRRWVDLGSAEKLEESGYSQTLTGGERDRFRMIWAPEAIYNPEKDNYLVYWSSSLMSESGTERADRKIYCCETEDFVDFGPVHLYTDQNSVSVNERGITWQASLDASQIRVDAEEGIYESGSSVFYRAIKNESNLKIYLESSTSLLDPEIDYDSSPLLTAVGNHYRNVPQANVQGNSGLQEGPSMFKFFDRDEWCLMIDNYGSMSIRYYPTTTNNLGAENSITKVADGLYSRSSYANTNLQDIGCHGGMMSITAEEYNTMIDVYNANPDIPNYHEIEYIKVDTREAQDAVDKAEAKIALNETYAKGSIQELKNAVATAKNWITAGTNSAMLKNSIVNITNAMNALKTVKEDEAEKEAANVITATANLKTTITSAEKKLKAASYSSGVTEVNKAIANARALFTKSNVTSAELKAADQAIKNAVSKLVVSKPSLKVSGKATIKLKRKKSITFKATTTNLSGKKITWSINKPKLVKLSKKQGNKVKLTAKKKKGTVRLTIKCGSKKVVKKIIIK